MTTGLDRQTGTSVTDSAHLVQSVRDILTTPIGSRVMRRSYGSRLPRILGQPQNAETRADIVAATAEALARWEPRIIIARITVRFASSGGVVIDLETDAGQLIEVTL